MPVKAVIYRDRGLNAIMKRLTSGANIAGRVGVLEPTASAPHPLRQNITIGEVAIINEYGSRRARVPKRSFLRSTFQDFKDTGRFMKLLGAGLAAVVDGTKGPRQVLLDVGAEMQRAVVFKIHMHVEPANHPRTIKNKGHDETLIHTGTLMNAISHDVLQHHPYGEAATRYLDDALPSEYESTEVSGGEGPYESVGVSEGIE